jgi:hypothetical protein
MTFQRRGFGLTFHLGNDKFACPYHRQPSSETPQTPRFGGTMNSGEEARQMILRMYSQAQCAPDLWIRHYDRPQCCPENTLSSKLNLSLEVISNMGHSQSGEAAGRSVSQEIPRFYGKRRFTTLTIPYLEPD